VVCHGMVIRAALAGRAGQGAKRFERVPNAALVPLASSPEGDPGAAEHADVGGGAAMPTS
jgi:hypothetical protein